MFDQNGALAGAYSYSPYGETRNTFAGGSAADSNSLRYIGGYFDRGSGLYKLGARYYDPTIGRFTQYDPTGQEPNPFVYTNGNPISALDPEGTLPVFLFPLAAAVARTLIPRLGPRAATSKFWGTASTRFRSAPNGQAEGTWNRRGTDYALGWSRGKPEADKYAPEVFRYRSPANRHEDLLILPRS